jgi:hypothetical protein
MRNYVVAGNMDNKFLLEIITAFINGDQDTESLKRKLLHSMCEELTPE